MVKRPGYRAGMLGLMCLVQILMRSLAFDGMALLARGEEHELKNQSCWEDLLALQPSYCSYHLSVS